MPWVITFNNDTEVETIGTVTASFVDPNGKPVVTLMDRLDVTSGKPVDDFVAKAQDLLATQVSTQTKVQQIIADLETKMNAGV
jgi:hypothetical protein